MEPDDTERPSALHIAVTAKMALLFADFFAGLWMLVYMVQSCPCSAFGEAEISPSSISNLA